MNRTVLVDMRAKGLIRFPRFTANFSTFAEAIEHWWKLPPESRAHAVLITEAQEVFQPGEIETINFAQR